MSSQPTLLAAPFEPPPLPGSLQHLPLPASLSAPSLSTQPLSSFFQPLPMKFPQHLQYSVQILSYTHPLSQPQPCTAHQMSRQSSPFSMHQSASYDSDEFHQVYSPATPASSFIGIFQTATSHDSEMVC